MVSGSKMKDIAQLTRIIFDPAVKKYAVEHWPEIQKKSKEEDDEWAKRLIGAIVREETDEIMLLIK